MVCYIYGHSYGLQTIRTLLWSLHYMDIIWTHSYGFITLYGHPYGLLHYMDIIWTHSYGFITLYGHPYGLLHYMNTPIFCYIIWTLLEHSYGFIIVYGHFYCLAVTTLLWFVNYMATPLVLFIILTLLLSVTLYVRFCGLLNYKDTFMVCKL